MALRCQHHDLLPRILRSNIHDGFPVHSHAADAEIIFIVLAGSHNGTPKQQCCNQSIISIPDSYCFFNLPNISIVKWFSFCFLALFETISFSKTPIRAPSLNIK